MTNKFLHTLAGQTRERASRLPSEYEDLPEQRKKALFRPQSMEEAKKALELGLIDISDYVQISLSMEPIIDALCDKDMAVRRQAILDLTKRRDRKKAVEKLRAMLQDQEEEVRLYAAEALDTIESDFHQRIYSLRQSLQHQPDDPGNLFELGVLYFNYADNFLPKGLLQQYFLDEAMKVFDLLLRNEPHNVEYLFFRGKTYKAKGNLSLALQDFKKVLQIDPHHFASSLKMAEIYYVLGDFVAVRRYCVMVSQCPLKEEHSQAVKFWVG